MYKSGQQRPLAIPTTLGSIEEAFTAIPTSGPAVATAVSLLVVTTAGALLMTAALDSAHFYICRTEC